MGSKGRLDRKLSGIYCRLARSQEPARRRLVIIPGRAGALDQRHLESDATHFALREKRIWIATFSQDGRLRAYAIFLLQKNREPQDRIRRVIVADFQSLDRDDSVYYAMLRVALEQSRKSGIHLLVTMGISASGTDMSAMAPHRGPLPRHSTSLFKARDPKLSRALESPQAWCPSLYDGDSSL
jgi:hypothetical protein